MIKSLALITVAAIGLLLAYAATRPDSFRVERSTTVAAPAEVEPAPRLPQINPVWQAQVLSHEDMARGLKRLQRQAMGRLGVEPVQDGKACRFQQAQNTPSGKMWPVAPRGSDLSQTTSARVRLR